jgi:hypothetical protein
MPSDNPSYLYVPIRYYQHHRADCATVCYSTSLMPVNTRLENLCVKVSSIISLIFCNTITWQLRLHHEYPRGKRIRRNSYSPHNYQNDRDICPSEVSPVSFPYKTQQESVFTSTSVYRLPSGAEIFMKHNIGIPSQSHPPLN